MRIEQSVLSSEWDLRERLAALRERELRLALRRGRDLSEATLEELLDRAEEAVISGRSVMVGSLTIMS